jgi:predicted acetyltransferase
METFVIDECDIDEHLDEAIRDTLVLCFPHRRETFSRARRWRGNTPLFNVVVRDGEIVCGYLAVVDRTIQVGPDKVRLAAVGLVGVAPVYRGKRLIDSALAAAMKEALRRRFPFGLLFTTRPTNRIYARNGWIELARRKVVRVEAGQEIETPPENVTMYYPLKEKDFPIGDIHLLGDKW